MDCSIIIPARNELFLSITVEHILQRMQGETEILVICDGNWPDPPVKDHSRVHLIYHSQSIGQRAATNEGARLSRAKYIMKVDAHCAFDEGFDVKMMQEMRYDWTLIPRMYNLHAFNWRCLNCGNETYQGPTPILCQKCQGKNFERKIYWREKRNPTSDFMRFDQELHFQYWTEFRLRPEAKPDVAPTMSLIGACWMMDRERFWELDGLDENHGSWGQMGTEIACKSWLSGGALMVNKKTWFAHMFRTQGGDFGFPYPCNSNPARRYSRKLWRENRWPKAKHDLNWLVQKFAPVPGWESPPAVPKKKLTKGIVYYTDNRLEPEFAKLVQQQIERCCNGFEIVAASRHPIHWKKNVVVSEKRSYLTMFKEILAGLEASTADIIFFAEHDVFYHPSHFLFDPPRSDVFYYDENRWFVDAQTGRCLFYHAMSTSMLCAHRSLLLEHYRKRVERVEREGKYDWKIGFEPGGHRLPRGIDNYGRQAYFSKVPSLDIRHEKNLTISRWTQEEFRNKSNLYAWTEADEVPGWGIIKGRFNDFIKEIRNAPPTS